MPEVRSYSPPSVQKERYGIKNFEQEAFDRHIMMRDGSVHFMRALVRALCEISHGGLINPEQRQTLQWYVNRTKYVVDTYICPKERETNGYDRSAG